MIQIVHFFFPMRTQGPSTTPSSRTSRFPLNKVRAEPIYYPYKGARVRPLRRWGFKRRKRSRERTLCVYQQDGKTKYVTPTPPRLCEVSLNYYALKILYIFNYALVYLNKYLTTRIYWFIYNVEILCTSSCAYVHYSYLPLEKRALPTPSASRAGSPTARQPTKKTRQSVNPTINQTTPPTSTGQATALNKDWESQSTPSDLNIADTPPPSLNSPVDQSTNSREKDSDHMEIDEPTPKGKTTLICNTYCFILLRINKLRTIYVQTEEQNPHSSIGNEEVSLRPQGSLGKRPAKPASPIAKAAVSPRQTRSTSAAEKKQTTPPKPKGNTNSYARAQHYKPKTFATLYSTNSLIAKDGKPAPKTSNNGIFTEYNASKPLVPSNKTKKPEEGNVPLLYHRVIIHTTRTGSGKPPAQSKDKQAPKPNSSVTPQAPTQEKEAAKGTTPLNLRLITHTSCKGGNKPPAEEREAQTPKPKSTEAPNQKGAAVDASQQTTPAPNSEQTRTSEKDGESTPAPGSEQAPKEKEADGMNSTSIKLINQQQPSEFNANFCNTGGKENSSPASSNSSTDYGSFMEVDSGDEGWEERVRARQRLQQKLAALQAERTGQVHSIPDSPRPNAESGTNRSAATSPKPNAESGTNHSAASSPKSSVPNTPRRVEDTADAEWLASLPYPVFNYLISELAEWSYQPPNPKSSINQEVALVTLLHIFPDLGNLDYIQERILELNLIKAQHTKKWDYKDADLRLGALKFATLFMVRIFPDLKKHPAITTMYELMMAQRIAHADDRPEPSTIQYYNRKNTYWPINIGSNPYYQPLVKEIIGKYLRKQEMVIGELLNEELTTKVTRPDLQSNSQSDTEDSGEEDEDEEGSSDDEGEVINAIPESEEDDDDEFRLTQTPNKNSTTTPVRDLDKRIEELRALTGGIPTLSPPRSHYSESQASSRAVTPGSQRAVNSRDRRSTTPNLVVAPPAPLAVQTAASVRAFTRITLSAKERKRLRDSAPTADDEEKLAMLTLEKINSEVAIDDLVQEFGCYRSFKAHDTYINVKTARAYVAFQHLSDFIEAVQGAYDLGQVVWSESYNPWALHGTFFKIFGSSVNLESTTISAIKKAVADYTGEAPSSITFTPEKQCVSIYYENKEPWKVLHDVDGGILTIREKEVNEDNIVIVKPCRIRIVRGFSATSDPTWSRLFMGGLPAHCEEEDLLELFSEAGLNTDHIIAAKLTHPKTNRAHNYGYILVSDAETHHELLRREWEWKGKAFTIEVAVAKQKTTALAK